ncbi:MAG TPA: PEP-CTERM sorting domain-containing protein [Methylotenera sp.]|nr:PEP-CTERM sorting domain-containing protein [Methylotenera sp.]HPH04248.1 PEP-CTERM sorting domain-containing protein [Methylotenera sp.]HPM99802.1 PEP-CTERM sorting domain-containing protein [Methylotenera sp.]
MKSKFVAATVLAMLVPAVGHAAPIVWSSEFYEIDTASGYLISGGSVVPSSNILANPLVGEDTVSAAAANITNQVSMQEFANANASEYEFKANVVVTPDDATNSVGVYPGASLTNTFVANTSVLNVAYDFSGLIQYSASTAGVSYQDLVVSFGLYDLTTSSSVTFQDFEALHRQNNSGPLNNQVVSAADETIPFSLVDDKQFSIVAGHEYQLKVNLFPSIFTSNTSSVNSSNSVLNIQFSDGNIAAVPEPETYALMLAGLALVGFTARRKQAYFSVGVG